MRDHTALEHIGQLNAVNPRRITADTGYQGSGRKDVPLSKHKHQCNKQHGEAEYIVEQNVAHLKR
ncbi:hypothetical protein FRX94_03700 [Corynebacterium canis]|uniref:Transposase n=1 Tax=Corynebacterium canis TaxID=679663 RepID=A0A5C5ULN3_9CORY|nr:hypothetical protein [Corynebacterium canis]TWT26956.1 hypothetical protein FRX94_03700 [Corynebacterium canis]